MKTKEPIRLRERETTTGLRSLYLDIYQKGKRHYEYLRLYLLPEKTRADKEKNRETMRLAEAIRAKRVVELRNDEYGFGGKGRDGTLFFPFFEKVAEGKGKDGTHCTESLWRTCLKHLRAYAGKDGLTFRDVTQQWVTGFRAYLDGMRSEIGGKRLSQNTKWVYMSKLTACLNEAMAQGVIRENPMQAVKRYKVEEVERSYLTLEELRRLAATPCGNDTTRRAFLFSCLTGLRLSDVARLTWGEVQRQDGFTRIVFKQKKTKGLEYLDIARQAEEYMGERGEAGEKVFKGLVSHHPLAQHLAKWTEAAGIDKHITFHCARHTFAVMMLDIGTDIYTVSKLLGHRELKTTQVYAKVLDRGKRAAVANIPDITGGGDGKR